MPRAARQDQPGQTSHIGSRGVDRQRIFLDDRDRLRILAIAARVCREYSVLCFAWALMANHHHFLLQPRLTPLGPVMHKLNLMYAQYFNEKYGRTGHLFENRYWSRPCEDDEGFRVRVRYVHLNPLRAGIVPDLDKLETYPWTGHAELIGHAPRRILSRQEVLDRFADGTEAALREIRHYFSEGTRPIRLEHPTLECALAEVCRIRGVLPAEVLTHERSRDIARVRTIAIFLAVRRAGLGIRATARGLGISPAGVRRALRRAESLETHGQLRIPKRLPDRLCGGEQRETSPLFPGISV